MASTGEKAWKGMGVQFYKEMYGGCLQKDAWHGNQKQAQRGGGECDEGIWETEASSMLELQ